MRSAYASFFVGFDMKRSLLVVLLSLFTLLLLSACARDNLESNVSLTDFKKMAARDLSQAEKPQQTIWDIALPVTDEGDYVLQAGDLLTVSVFGIEELQAEVRINSRGFVSLPLLDRVMIQGLTAAEAEEKIEAILRENYIRNPYVTLIIKEMVGQQITMVGALKNPGTFEIKSRKTILDLVAMSGGLAADAGNVALVTRNMNEGKGSRVFRCDIHSLIRKGDVDMNMPVRGGDVIFIPKAGTVLVDGAVRDPKVVNLEGKMGIEEALSAAGGLAKYADLEDIKLLRTMASGERAIVQLTMADIQTANGPEFILQENDMIYVEASGSRMLVTGSGASLGFMGTGFSYSSPEK